MADRNPRVFKYGDQEFPGNGQTYDHPQISNQEVLSTLAMTFPELASADIEVEHRNDGIDVVTFVKRAGALG